WSVFGSVFVGGRVWGVAAITITATLQNNNFVQKMISLEPFGIVILTLLKFVPYLTLWGAFTFLYFFIPNTRVKLTSALVGGLVAAVLWQPWVGDSLSLSHLRLATMPSIQASPYSCCSYFGCTWVG